MQRVPATESQGRIHTSACTVAVMPEIEKTAKLVQEIAAASLEQNSGADQVNGAIQQLNQVTQQNAAASEEMATSSEELAGQAEQLKETISFFKLDEFGATISNRFSKNEVKTKHTIAHIKSKTADSNRKTGVNLEMYDDQDKQYEKF